MLVLVEMLEIEMDRARGLTIEICLKESKMESMFCELSRVEMRSLLLSSFKVMERETALGNVANRLVMLRIEIGCVTVRATEICLEPSKLEIMF